MKGEFGSGVVEGGGVVSAILAFVQLFDGNQSEDARVALVRADEHCLVIDSTMKVQPRMLGLSWCVLISTALSIYGSMEIRPRMLGLCRIWYDFVSGSVWRAFGTAC